MSDRPDPLDDDANDGSTSQPPVPSQPKQNDSDSLAQNDELTQEDLQTRLAVYQAAIKAEFEIKTGGASGAEELKEITQDFFRKNANAAAAQVVWLSQNSTSDSVRLSASKYVIDKAFHEEAESGDPIKSLLNELANK